MVFFELFYVFFIIGAFTFGGGYAMINMFETQVVSRGWVDANTITNFIGISEATPGPFAINMATFVGSTVGFEALGEGGRFLGALCATLGMILPSFIIILLLATVLTKFAHSKYWKGAINGNKPIVIALITSTAIMLIVKTFFFNGDLNSSFTVDYTSISIFIVLFAIYFLYQKIFKKKINTILLLVIAALLGIAKF